MDIDQRELGDALLIKAGALLRLSSDMRSHEKAFALVQRAVIAGEVGGHAMLARMYEQGIGTRRRLTKATQHYALAAIHGDAEADRTWGWLMALEGFLWHRGDVFNRF
ncbi:sel1 repeat family protein [Azonexus fungiphilus]|uniref:sel1 repeat family protein n=1 Tax=Azonexus fungiphilus TaxID=146940 RepID=UPI00156B9BB5|nr:sel1 repeat family protein [Azonexus fungiphilus]NHC06947.1 sel1 repeat family protein [Azonexus fungiphilus]